MAKITVKWTTIYGAHGEIKDEGIETYESMEAFEASKKETEYRLGWEGCPSPNYEIINTEENNESNKI